MYSSRKGTQETAGRLQQDAERNGRGGAPSAFVASPAQHARLQVGLMISRLIITSYAFQLFADPLTRMQKYSEPSTLRQIDLSEHDVARIVIMLLWGNGDW